MVDEAVTLSHFTESFDVTGVVCKYGAGDAPAGSSAVMLALGREEGDSQVAAGVASETVASCVPR